MKSTKKRLSKKILEQPLSTIVALNDVPRTSKVGSGNTSVTDKNRASKNKPSSNTNTAEAINADGRSIKVSTTPEVLRENSDLSKPKRKWFEFTEDDCNLREAQKVFPNSKLMANPAKLVLDIDKMLPMTIKRQEVIHELISTEYDYHLDLKVVIDMYMQALSNFEIVTNIEFQTLFSNIEQLATVSRTFLNMIKLRKRENFGLIGDIGDLFQGIVEKFTIYHIYCSNFTAATQILQSKRSDASFQSLLNKFASSPTCSGLDLASYLLKPVQRICKYPLLLRELLKYTDEKGKDHKALKNALSAVNNALAFVNEKRSESELKKQLIVIFSQLEPNELLDELLSREKRTLVYESVLNRVAKNPLGVTVAAPRKCILFSDYFVIAKPGVFAGIKLQIVDVLSIWNMVVSDLPDLETRRFRFCIKVGTKKEYIFSSASQGEKTTWIAKFVYALDNAVKNLGRLKPYNTGMVRSSSDGRIDGTVLQDCCSSTKIVDILRQHEDGEPSKQVLVRQFKSNIYLLGDDILGETKLHSKTKSADDLYMIEGDMKIKDFRNLIDSLRSNTPFKPLKDQGQIWETEPKVKDTPKELSTLQHNFDDNLSRRSQNANDSIDTQEISNKIKESHLNESRKRLSSHSVKKYTETTSEQTQDVKNDDMIKMSLSGIHISGEFKGEDSLIVVVGNICKSTDKNVFDEITLIKTDPLTTMKRVSSIPENLTLESRRCAPDALNEKSVMVSEKLVASLDSNTALKRKLSISLRKAPPPPIRKSSEICYEASLNPYAKLSQGPPLPAKSSKQIERMQILLTSPGQKTQVSLSSPVSSIVGNIALHSGAPISSEKILDLSGQSQKYGYSQFKPHEPMFATNTKALEKIPDRIMRTITIKDRVARLPGSSPIFETLSECDSPGKSRQTTAPVYPSVLIMDEISVKSVLEVANMLIAVPPSSFATKSYRRRTPTK